MTYVICFAVDNRQWRRGQSVDLIRRTKWSNDTNKSGF